MADVVALVTVGTIAVNTICSLVAVVVYFKSLVRGHTEHHVDLPLRYRDMTALTRAVTLTLILTLMTRWMRRNLGMPSIILP